MSNSRETVNEKNQVASHSHLEATMCGLLMRLARGLQHRQRDNVSDGDNAIVVVMAVAEMYDDINFRALQNDFLEMLLETESSRLKLLAVHSFIVSILVRPTVA